MSFDIAVLNVQTIRDYVLKGLLFSVALTFVATVGGIVLGSLIAMMRLRHSYHPNLIGALIGALLCFLLLEALPALT